MIWYLIRYAAIIVCLLSALEAYQKNDGNLALAWIVIMLGIMFLKTLKDFIGGE